MKIALITIEFIASLALVVAILLHSAKGEGLGAIGGEARLFRSNKGLESGLNKITGALAAIFLLTAGILGVFF